MLIDETLEHIQKTYPFFKRRYLIEISYTYLYRYYLSLHNLPTQESPQQLIEIIYRAVYKKCDGCNNHIYKYNIREFRGIYLCKTCQAGSLVHCHHCEGRYSMDDLNIHYTTSGWRCSGCVAMYAVDRRNRDINIPFRAYAKMVIGSGEGTTIQSSRRWSTEIELYLTDIEDGKKQINKLPPTFGIVHDGSLRNVGSNLKDGRQLKGAYEIQTPILVGKKGEEYITELCKTLNYRDNAQVDSTCGMHIHIDMSDCDKDIETLKRLLAFHWVYEPVIMSFLPSTRRSNIYCKSLKNDYHYDSILQTKTMKDLFNVWYRGNQDANRYDKKLHPRYHGINLHDIFSSGHMEVRYHSGTTNAKKIMHWANLHTRIIDYCMGKLGTMPEIEKIISNGITPIGKSRTTTRLTRQLFDLLNLNDDCVSYLKTRQKKFHKNPKSEEHEFNEKEPAEDLEPKGKGYQLTLAEYQELIRTNNQEVKKCVA